MLDKLKKLREDVTPEDDLLSKIEIQVPQLFIDLDSASSFFTGEFDNRYLIDQIILACEIKSYLEDHREHVKKTLKKHIQPYDLYLEKSGDHHFSKKNFNDLYDALCKIDIDNRYLRIESKALRIIEKLNTIAISDDNKTKILNHLIKDVYSGVQNASELLIRDDKFDNNYSILKKISDSLYKDRFLAIDVLLYLTQNTDYTDAPLETTFIYNHFEKLIFANDYTNITFVEPSLFFVRRIFNNPRFQSKEIKIYLSDKHALNILNYAYHKKNIKFEGVEQITHDKAKIVLSDAVFIFGNNISDCNTIIDTLDPIANLSFQNNNIILFDRDFRIFKKNIISGFLSKLHVKNINLLPGEITKCTRPARKSIVHFSKYPNEKEYIDIYKYSLLKDGLIQAISSKVHSLKVSETDYKSFDTSFRKLFRDYEYISSKERRSFKYEFSNELIIRYSFSNNKRLRAEMLNPFAGSERKKTIDYTRVSVVLKNSDDLEKWLENVYPYASFRDSKMKSTVQYEVSQMFKSYGLKSMTLKTFMFIYKDQIDFIPRSFPDLYKDVLNSSISDIYLEYINEDNIFELIDNLLDKYSHHTSQYHIVAILQSIFDIATKGKLISTNPVDSIKKELSFNDSTVFEIKEALAINHLTLDRRKNIINDCNKNISKNPGVNIGILMRLFLALLPKEICALNWGSFKQYDDFYYLVITDVISKDGNSIVPIDNSRKIRCIPLGPHLTSIILKEKERQLNLFKDTQIEFNKRSIICGKDKCIDGYFDLLSVEKLYKESQKLLKKYDVADEFISIPTNNDSFVEIDLTSTRGDIFRSNYRHYIAVRYICSHDIYTYVAGVKGLDVFSDHYCDYKNKSILKIIYKTQKQIEEVLING